jgi:hypothetical protein
MHQSNAGRSLRQEVGVIELLGSRTRTQRRRRKRSWGAAWAYLRLVFLIRGTRRASHAPCALFITFHRRYGGLAEHLCVIAHNH